MVSESNLVDNYKIALRTNSRIKIISCHNIVHCTGDGRYTKIFLKNGETILVARLLKDFERKLPEDLFIRIHKSYIVNIIFIKEYNSFNQNILLSENNNKEFKVAKRRKKRLLEKISQNFLII